MSIEPVTAEEQAAVLRIFHAAADTRTKAEIRARYTKAIEEIRENSGPWAVHAESFDMPGPGPVVSTHPNEAAALTECRRLNREYTGDAGSYTIRRATP